MKKLTGIAILVLLAAIIILIVFVIGGDETAGAASVSMIRVAGSGQSSERMHPPGDVAREHTMMDASPVMWMVG